MEEVFAGYTVACSEYFRLHYLHAIIKHLRSVITCAILPSNVQQAVKSNCLLWKMVENLHILEPKELVVNQRRERLLVSQYQRPWILPDALHLVHHLFKVNNSVCPFTMHGFVILLCKQITIAEEEYMFLLQYHLIMPLSTTPSPNPNVCQFLSPNVQLGS